MGGESPSPEAVRHLLDIRLRDAVDEAVLAAGSPEAENLLAAQTPLIDAALLRLYRAYPETDPTIGVLAPGLENRQGDSPDWRWSTSLRTR